MTVFERTIRSLLTAGIENIQVFSEKNSSKFAEIIEKKGPWSGTIKLLQSKDLESEIRNLKNVILMNQPLLVTPRYIKEH